LGINSSFMVDSQNINFAVPAPTLAIALRRARAVSGDLHFPQLGDKEFSMGLLYYEGRGVPQDYAEAAKLMRQAADQGHAEAQATLGALYQSGRGVLQDYGQAAAWFRKSAEQGFPFGQLFLGVLLSEGHQGVPKDDIEAAMWFRRAAEQGNALAQVWLADAYHAGRGVPQDWSEAYFWYKVASSVGKVKGLLTEEDFSILLNLAASSLTPEELSRAQGRAQKWIAEHPSN
jgi:TPR repeat protein